MGYIFQPGWRFKPFTFIHIHLSAQLVSRKRHKREKNFKKKTKNPQQNWFVDRRSSIGKQQFSLYCKDVRYVNKLPHAGELSLHRVYSHYCLTALPGNIFTAEHIRKVICLSSQLSFGVAHTVVTQLVTLAASSKTAALILMIVLLRWWLLLCMFLSKYYHYKSKKIYNAIFLN